MDKSTVEKTGWNKAVNVLSVIFIISFAYAIIRYNVIRDVPIENIPLFISNKAIALAATILIGISFLLGPLARFFPNRYTQHLYLRKHIGLVGFGLGALHSLMSLALLSPAYYGKFYDGDTGKFNAIGEGSLLFGVLAFIVFSLVSITSIPSIAERMTQQKWQTIQRMGYLAYIFVLLHVVVMGFAGWLHASAYQYGFISVSLVAALVIILVLTIRILVLAFPRSSKK